jgi:hypothetical protein
MSIDVAGLLHESIDRLTEGERLPGGLAERAFRRHRQRRIALGAAGTVLAAAAAVLVAAASTGGIHSTGGIQQHGSGTLTAHTATYVIGRTERALAAVERGNLLQEIHVVGQGSGFILTPEVPPADIAPQAVIWSYHGRFRAEGLGTDGRPVFDAIAEEAGQLQTARIKGVEYPKRIWWTELARHFRLPRGAQAGCEAAVLPPPIGVQINWPASIRKALSCSAYRIAGHPWIAGIHTIKIVTAKRPGQPVPPISQVFWVNPATYLPVRARWAWPVSHGKPTTILTGDFQWLTPTAAHLAALRVSVPPGFRRVPSGRVVNGYHVPLIEFTLSHPFRHAPAGSPTP